MIEQYGGNKKLIIGGVVALILIIIIVFFLKFRSKNCEVSEWNNWSECSATCGGGMQTRFRLVKKQAENGGKVCPSLTESRTCNTQSCSVDCEVSDWSEWSTCSATCGGGIQTRSRTIKKQAVNGGKACPIDLSENRTCNSQECPIDCEVKYMIMILV